MGLPASMPPPPPPVQPGDVVAGKYVVDRAIAAGGMGLVFAAKHVELDQAVALKFMRAELRGQISTSRFALEARATAKLRSAHVARVYDVGVLKDGTPFMVMELLEGIDLENLLEERGRLTSEIAAELVTQACEAVAEAHGVGIIHRDLKPANLFLSKTPQGSPFVKVLDFGISKATKDVVPSSATAAGTIMGSPPYMSPETLRSSRSADARSDIWSLGVILYELVTGRLPFDGEGIGDIALKVHHDEPIWPMAFDPNIPEAYDAIVRACLQKDASKRYETVNQLRSALLSFSATRSSGAMTLSLRTSQPRIVVVDDDPEPPPAPTPRTAARIAEARAATTVLHETETEKLEKAAKSDSLRPRGRNPKLLALAAGSGAAIAAALAIVIMSRTAVGPASASPRTDTTGAVIAPTTTTSAATPTTTTPAPNETSVVDTPVAPAPRNPSLPQGAVLVPPRPTKATAKTDTAAPTPKDPAATAATAAATLTSTPPTVQPAATASGRAIRDRGF